MDKSYATSLVLLVAASCLLGFAFADGESVTARLTFPGAASTSLVTFTQKGAVVDVSMSLNVPVYGSGSLAYHIHEFPVNPAVNENDVVSASRADCMSTGLHHNPTFVAAGVSEVGDLSARHGGIDVSAGTTDGSPFIKNFTDSIIAVQTGVNAIDGRSIVFHFPNGTRWACGTVGSKTSRFASIILPTIPAYDAAGAVAFGSAIPIQSTISYFQASESATPVMYTNIMLPNGPAHYWFSVRIFAPSAAPTTTQTVQALCDANGNAATGLGPVYNPKQDPTPATDYEASGVTFTPGLNQRFGTAGGINLFGPLSPLGRGLVLTSSSSSVAGDTTRTLVTCATFGPQSTARTRANTQVIKVTLKPSLNVDPVPTGYITFEKTPDYAAIITTDITFPTFTSTSGRPVRILIRELPPRPVPFSTPPHAASVQNYLWGGCNGTHDIFNPTGIASNAADLSKVVGNIGERIFSTLPATAPISATRYFKVVEDNIISFTGAYSILGRSVVVIAPDATLEEDPEGPALFAAADGTSVLARYIPWACASIGEYPDASWAITRFAGAANSPKGYVTMLQLSPTTPAVASARIILSSVTNAVANSPYTPEASTETFIESYTYGLPAAGPGVTGAGSSGATQCGAAVVGLKYGPYAPLVSDPAASASLSAGLGAFLQGSERYAIYEGAFNVSSLRGRSLVAVTSNSRYPWGCATVDYYSSKTITPTADESKAFVKMERPYVSFTITLQNAAALKVSEAAIVRTMVLSTVNGVQSFAHSPTVYKYEIGASSLKLTVGVRPTEGTSLERLYTAVSSMNRTALTSTLQSALYARTSITVGATQLAVITPSTCADGVMNGGESDVDCGNVANTGCMPCGGAKKCTADADCLSGVCTLSTKQCAVPSYIEELPNTTSAATIAGVPSSAATIALFTTLVSALALIFLHM